MVDLNSDEYLIKLNKASASEAGQIIIEYLKHEADKYRYEDIVIDKMSEVGMNFVVIKEIKEYLRNVLSRLDNAI